MSLSYDAHRRITAICLIGIFLMAVMPIVGAIDYQYGGTYTREAYPLAQANDELTAALTYIPFNPFEIENNTALAWAFVNQSDVATGVGTGAVAWLWPTPTQTFGYLDDLLNGTIQSMHAYIASGGLFKNTSVASWGQIGATIEGAQNVIQNIHDDIVSGNKAWVLEAVSWGATTVTLVLVALVNRLTY